ncbi:F-box protein At1g10110-like [Zingiber officinale]|uniref:F-box protein At1g10110-like n=2 Tax=Zingiber officinale TaxID=94328 RepID=UPI001C4BCE42|nr:F-box protein At1g10110-like [Zingiber officinale]
MSIYWSEISTDLLYLILSKVSIPDLFRCAAVCSHWSAVVDMVRRRSGGQRPQIPWLVPEHHLLINGRHNDQNTYNFFSLSEGRVYDIPSRAPGILIVGSSHGWLITTNEVSVQLLNPITGVQIDLPSIPTNRNLEAIRAVLSCDPSRCGDYSVGFVFYCRSMEKELLFLASAGDDKWKMIPGNQYHYDDIAFHNGKLYAVSRFEEDDEVIVVAFDLITLDSTPTRTPVVALPFSIWDFTFDMHFVCTYFGDLLIARATITNELVDYNKKLEVWKVDTEKGAMVALNNLGKYALFLGTGSSFCLDTCSLPDLKSNSIYLSNELGNNLVYSLEDESFTSLSLPSLSSPKLERSPLVWFTPSIAC